MFDWVLNLSLTPTCSEQVLVLNYFGYLFACAELTQSFELFPSHFQANRSLATQDT